jgi:hypothetical protein
MFSIKRSAASLGIVAGLLAAAAPASAQVLPGMVGVKSPTDPASGYTPPIGTDKGSLAAAEQGVWGPIVYVGHAGVGARGVDVSADHLEYYIVTNNNDPDAMATAFDAKSAKEGLYFKTASPTDGTQVGSEGVKAPTSAGTQIGFED